MSEYLNLINGLHVYQRNIKCMDFPSLGSTKPNICLFKEQVESSNAVHHDVSIVCMLIFKIRDDKSVCMCIATRPLYYAGHSVQRQPHFLHKDSAGSVHNRGPGGN
jgi:hypothetical protein